MNDNVIQMNPARYEFTKEQVDAINRAAIETPAFFGYLSFPSPGRFVIDVCPYEHRRDPASRSHEVALYSATQAKQMVIDAFMAGVREAVPSRWQELKDGTSKSVTYAAEYYASKVMGGICPVIPHPYVPQHVCPLCAATPCTCHQAPVDG